MTDVALPPSANIPPARPTLGLYNAVWRWHLYAALFVTPFILVFAVTGSIYLFKPQIEQALYGHLYHVPPVTESVSPDAQVRAVMKRFPGSLVQSYRPPVDSTDSARVRIQTALGQKYTVAMDPHTGAVLGAINKQDRPLHIVKNLHSKLLFGKVGQAVQELAASWAMVLILTGLYLWWPRRSRRFWGVFLPRWNRSRLPGRVFWRDIHAVTGFWVSGLLIFLIMTGLPWSLVSGGLIHQAAASIGKGSPNTGLDWGSSGSRTIKSAPVEEAWPAEHARQLAGASSSGGSSLLAPLRLSKVLDIARHLPGIQAPFEVRMPVDARGVYSIVVDHDDRPSDTAYVHLDQYTGKVIREVRWRDFGPLAQAIAVGVSLHEGQYFGLANQLLGLAACLGLMVLTLAGLMMWWRRRPSGSMGTPPIPSEFRLHPGLVGLIVLLSVLMPLMGASLVLILAIEGLLRRFRPELFPHRLSDEAPGL